MTQTMEEVLRNLIGREDKMDRAVASAMSTALYAYNFNTILVYMYEAYLDDIHDKIMDTWNNINNQDEKSDAEMLASVKLALEEMDEDFRGIREQQQMAGVLRETISEQSNGKKEDMVLAGGEKAPEAG